jgi:hypothetical protein
MTWTGVSKQYTKILILADLHECTAQAAARMYALARLHKQVICSRVLCVLIVVAVRSTSLRTEKLRVSLKCCRIDICDHINAPISLSLIEVCPPDLVEYYLHVISKSINHLQPVLASNSRDSVLQQIRHRDSLLWVLRVPP